MRKIQLSICIATYNRANYIGDTLESIIPQLDDDIEILVVDGASTDNTEVIVRQYAKKESRIRYIRLAAKGGVDQDYNKSVEFARGEYCWLFTDDDILRPGAVKAVKNAIIEDHDLVIINAEVRDRTLSAILQRQRIVLQDNKVFASDEMETLFVDALDHITFIGAVVIRTSVWLSRDRESYFGSEFVHVGVIFQKPLIGSALIIVEPYISIRYGNGQWVPRSFDIWMFKWPKLVWSFNHISTASKLKVCKKKPWLNFRNLIVQRSYGVYNIKIFHQFFSTMKVNILWKFMAWIIARSPRKLIIVFHFLYSRIKGPEARASFANNFSKQKV